MPSSLARELVAPGLRIDRAGLYASTAALNTIPVVAALAVGLATGDAGAGVLVGGGALFAGFPGLGAPPRRRMTAMGVSSVLILVSTFVGVWTGGDDVLAVVLMAVWAFGGAMAGAIGRTEGLIGATTVLGLLLVADYPGDAETAALRALAAFSGALLQVAVSAAAWRVIRDRPQRGALSGAYAHLAALARAPYADGDLLPLFAVLRETSSTVFDAEGGPQARSPRGAARRELLEAADAIVLDLAALRRLRDGDAAPAPVRAAVATVLAEAADDLDAIARALGAARGAGAVTAPAERMSVAQDALQEACAGPLAGGPAPPASAAREALDRLAGLRRGLRQAWGATGAATGPHERGRVLDPAGTRRRLREDRDVVAANLTLRSAVLRHALRLAGATAFGVALYRAIDLPFGYWVPLTVLFVLRPDFGSTFSRGALRAAGTLLGIVLAGALAIAIGSEDWLLLPFAALGAWGAFAFLFANYALFTTAITMLVLLLQDLAGTPADEAIVHRLIASAIGIAISLAAFLLWPTWSGPRMAAAIGDYLEALRAYAVGTLRACAAPSAGDRASLAALRGRLRLARANADDVLAAAMGEPESHRPRAELAAHLLGAGYRVHEATVILDADLTDGPPPAPTPQAGALAGDVDDALRAVRAAWEGRAAAPGTPVPGDPLPEVPDRLSLAGRARAVAVAARRLGAEVGHDASAGA